MVFLEHQTDSDLHSNSRELPLQDFYRCIPAHRYGKIRKHAQVMSLEIPMSMSRLSARWILISPEWEMLYLTLTYMTHSTHSAPTLGAECVGLGLQCVTLEYVLLHMINVLTYSKYCTLILKYLFGPVKNIFWSHGAMFCFVACCPAYYT